MTHRTLVIVGKYDNHNLFYVSHESGLVDHKSNGIIFKLTISGSDWGASLVNFSMNDCCLSTVFDTFSRISLSHFLEHRTSLPLTFVYVVAILNYP